jgi:hypothetical protein
LRRPKRLNNALLKPWYAKDCRKVPESWKKNYLPAAAPYFVLVLIFLLTVFPGTERWRDPPWTPEFRGKHSVYLTGMPLKLRHVRGTGKLLAKWETGSVIQSRPETRKFEKQKLEEQKIGKCAISK